MKYLAERELFWQHQLRVYVENGSMPTVTKNKCECGPAQSKLWTIFIWCNYVSFWLLTFCLVVSVLVRDVLDNEQWISSKLLVFINVTRINSCLISFILHYIYIYAYQVLQWKKLTHPSPWHSTPNDKIWKLSANWNVCIFALIKNTFFF